MSWTLMLVAGAFFMAMLLMRMTYRMSRRDRSDGLKWRGIDWTGVKLPEEKTASERSESSPDKEASEAPPSTSS